MKCDEKAVLLEPNLCKNHFFTYFENKFKKAIKDFNLIKKEDKICVATSGGKDSLVLLYLINKNYKKVTALLIDEGIDNYREFSIKDFLNFCNKYEIKYQIVSFKKEIGYTLDNMITMLKKSPCTICGAFRRFLLNKHSQEYDILVTGHNLDDEAQSILMNILRYQEEILARIGPISGVKKREGFVKRIKPLYYLKEKEILLYSYLKGFKTSFEECPYADTSFRNDARDLLNNLEVKKKIKKNVIDFHIQTQDKLKNYYKNTKTNKCQICHFPSQKKVCNACEIKQELKLIKKSNE
jgi:uncharacterized protein (TIGR00269 family)